MRVMQGRTVHAITQPDVGPGYLFQHKGKILGPHARRLIPMDGVNGRHRLQSLHTNLRMLGIIDGGRITGLIIQLGPQTVKSGQSLYRLLKPLLQACLQLRIKTTNRASEMNRLGDDIIGMAGLNTGKTQYRWLMGRHLARNHPLQLRNQLTGRQDGVRTLLGLGRMTALTVQGQIKNIKSRHYWTIIDHRLAQRQPRPIMHSKDRIHGKALKQPLLNHDTGTALIFLGWLKDEVHRTGKVWLSGEAMNRTQEHGHMTIMATGMHLALDSGLIG